MPGHSAAENGFLVAFMPIDLCPPAGPAGREMGFQSSVGQHVLGAGTAEAGLWLWKIDTGD